MSAQLSRRDFLKLSSLLPLLGAGGSLALNPAPTALQDPTKPNVLILVLDALSAHDVPLYGYGRETTPNLAKFADRATTYHNHYAGGNFTTSGTASLLTGTYPWTHRAMHLYGNVEQDYARRNLFNLFKALDYHSFAYSHNDLATLLLHQFHEDISLLVNTRELCLFYENIYTDRLFPGDYQASFLSEAAITQGTMNRFIPTSLFMGLLHQLWRVNRKDNLRQRYQNLFPRGLPSLDNTLAFFLLEDAIDWLTNHLAIAPRPFLGYFHVLPPHAPYATRRDFVDIFDDGWMPPEKQEHFFTENYPYPYLAKMRREYDEYIAYADAEFGRLYQFMESKGMLENTYLIVTADHGEMFERGILAHNTPTLFDPVVHVPLLISGPGQTERVDIHATTSCVDLLPTLMHLTGGPAPDWSEGTLLPGFGGDETASRSIYSVEAKSNPKQAPLRKGTALIQRDGHKLVHYFGYDNFENEYELYDLQGDPEEMENVYTSQKSIASALQDELSEKVNAANQKYGA